MINIQTVKRYSSGATNLFHLK